MVKTRGLPTLLLVVCCAVTCHAVEIATGKMLGKGYQERWFYVRENPRARWVPTYTGVKYRPDAAGRLMNIRIAQALFDDEWLTEVAFDPEANTDRVIAALDTYRDNGVLAINVSLQGGNPGYKEAVPEIQRSYEFSAGRGSVIAAAGAGICAGRTVTGHSLNGSRLDHHGGDRNRLATGIDHANG
jgi:hypothetical protein